MKPGYKHGGVPGNAPGRVSVGVSGGVSSWTQELALRARRLFLLKLLGTSGVIGLFFIAYFHVLRHPIRPVTLMPITALDELLPFQPSMVYAYVSLWLYVGIAPGLQLSVRQLLVYAMWAVGLCLAGLAIFSLWPTAVQPMAGISGATGLQILQGLDASGNACPSMHVAFAVFTALWIEHVLKTARTPMALRAINGLWCAAIVWSTLAIRQHVVLDAAAGALLGAIWGLVSLHWRVDADSPRLLGALRLAARQSHQPSS